MTASRFRYLGAAHAYGLGVKIGLCPCEWGDGFPTPALAEAAAEDPGPRHIPECTYVARFGEDGNEECEF